MLAAAAVSTALAGAATVVSTRAQEPAAPAADQIKRDLETIKKTRTIAIIPAEGSNESGGETLLRLENTSAFPIVVLIVGPSVERVELDGFRMQTLKVKAGDYEIAMKVTGRPVPPFYGRQKILANQLFNHKFVVPPV